MDILRLDLIHPVISGNKWFKLKYHVQQAKHENKKGILTFGGAWSNHLVATAFACRQAGLSAIGVIRGEKPATLSPSLLDLQQYGMHLHFVSRWQYADQNNLINDLQKEYTDHYIVPQGGQGAAGVQGAAEILQLAPLLSYTHIACAAGTGTMLAGIVQGSLPHQQVMGISSLKMENTARNSLQAFVDEQTGKKNYRIFFDYHFGGYARKNGTLTGFMNDLYREYSLPTDFVYTAKLLYGVTDLLTNNFFPPGSRLLVIHSGGLQGNRSLPPGTLTFI